MAAAKRRQATGAKKCENGRPKTVRNGPLKKCENERKSAKTVENKRKQAKRFEEEGRGTRNGYEASKGSKGISGL